VAHPPIWDRALDRAGHWLVDRAAKHQHPVALQAVTVVPVPAAPAVTVVPMQIVPTPAMASPSAQSEQPNPPVPILRRAP